MSSPKPQDETLPTHRPKSSPAPGDDGPKSVVHILAERAGIDASVHLRELAEDPGPVHRPEGSRESGLPPRIGRYQVAGQLARGGVGSVHKARDVDLGRDVAIKVLLEQYRGDAEMLRRFVEEAQISGQLQHPGIVPIHEMGLVAGDRPYIAMKLVKGQTLARLLDERKDPASDRQRFLSIFERICQPVAYAHARGVIHRDLKPSNVMVGSFGEVQVMDWGLAKVLDQGGVADERPPSGASRDASVIKTLRTGTPGSDSLAGSVLGTPAYMAPEQARGEVDRLDERCDVFGLGAILCEILTGRPPYPGATVPAVHRAAQNGDLGAAVARIEACGAEREVIDLARSCLAVEPRDRPRDAGAVDRAMRAHLDSLSERARALEIQAAEARVRASGERKARRLTAALALVCILVVSGGAAIFTVFERDRRELAGRAVAEVRTALAQAETLRDRARVAPRRNAAEWELALDAARRAENLARDQGAGLLAQAGDLARQIEKERKDSHFVARLESALERYANLSPTATQDDLATAFRGRFDCDLLALERDRAMELLRDVGHPAVLASALDLWAAASREVRGDWRPLQELAIGIDPEPFLKKAREAVLAGEVPDLTAELAIALETRVPLAHLAFLDGFFAHLGDRSKGLAVARRAMELYPEEYWPHLRVGQALLREDPPRTEEGLRHLVASQARRPNSRYVLDTLQAALERAGKHGEALELLARGTWLRPGHGDFFMTARDLLRRQEVADLGPSLEVASESWERLLGSGKLVSSLARELAALARARRHLAHGEEIEALRVLERAQSFPDATLDLHDGVASLRGRASTAYASYASIDAALAAPETLAPEGARWRFFRGAQQPAAATAWALPEFDDAAWEEGESGFGYGDGDDRTVLDDMRGAYTTVYLRRVLEAPPRDRFERLAIEVRVDDGCVVYWNGEEIGRSGLARAVRPRHTSVSNRNVDDAVLESFELPARLLREGANLIAVQGFNVSRSSSDFTLIPTLVGHLLPRDAAARARERLTSWRASRPPGDIGRSTPELLRYHQARVLQLEGDLRGAAAQLRAVLETDRSEIQPYLRLAECLRGAGADARAEEELRGLLAGPDRRFVPLWEDWLARSFVDGKRSPAELLPLLPPANSAGGYGGEARWLLETLARGETIRINCGSERHQTAAGVIWERDRFYRGGDTSENLEEGRWLATEIHGTEEDALFGEERYFRSRRTERSGYCVPLPPGRYRVRLHFSEIWTAQPGRRVFDVAIEDNTVLDDYDIVERVGFATLDVHTFEVEVVDGRLDIVFRHEVENPKLSALEVEPLARGAP